MTAYFRSIHLSHYIILILVQSKIIRPYQSTNFIRSKWSYRLLWSLGRQNTGLLQQSLHCLGGWGLAGGLQDRLQWVLSPWTHKGYLCKFISYNKINSCRLIFSLQYYTQKWVFKGSCLEMQYILHAQMGQTSKEMRWEVDTWHVRCQGHSTQEEALDCWRMVIKYLIY